MSDHHLKEQTLDSHPVFQGDLLKVWTDRVRLPNGQEAGREYIRHPGAVAVIARLANGNLLLERQYRHPLGQVMLELPAGKIDPGEDLLACARRELQEETGYAAREWRLLGRIHPCVGYSDEHIDLFLADDLCPVGNALDEGEFIELVEMSFGEAMSAVLDGRITDGKTVAGLFWAAHVLGGGAEGSTPRG